MKPPPLAITETSSKAEMLAYIDRLESRLETRAMPGPRGVEDGGVISETVHLSPEERARTVDTDLDGVGARNATTCGQNEVFDRQSLRIAELEQVLTRIAALAPATTDMRSEHEMADLAAQGLEGGLGALEFVGEAVARRAYRHGLNSAMRMIPEDTHSRDLLAYRGALAAEINRRDRDDRFPVGILEPFKARMEDLEERIPMPITPNLTF